jgi:hypothetical protein
MNKNLVVTLCSIMLIIAVTIALAADTNKITRFTSGFIVQGGTSSTTGNSLVESDAVTNCFRMVVVTATVSGAQTSSTNTFSTAFVATPIAIPAFQSGANGTQTTNSWSVGATVSTSTLIVTGLSTNASTGVNNLPILVYGYPRTGILQ